MMSIREIRGGLLITLMCMALAAWMGASLGDRTLPVTSRVDAVLTPIVAPGDRLLLKTTVKREDRCPSDVTEFLFDKNGIRWLMPAQHYPSPPGLLGVESFITPVMIPKDFPEGPAMFRRTIAFTCNFAQWFNPVVEVLPDIKFEVRAN